MLSLFQGCFFGSFEVSEVPLEVLEACGFRLWGTASSLSVACVLGLQVLCQTRLPGFDPKSGVPLPGRIFEP